MRMEFLWLALIVVFAVIEGATTALTTVWFIGGALAALAAALLHAELWLQITLFFAVSVVLLAALRPLVKKYLRPRTVRTNAAGNIGREAIVTEAIDNLHETGAVRLSGVEWTARSADGSPVAVGTVVRIDAIEGVKLIVTPSRSPQISEGESIMEKIVPYLIIGAVALVILIILIKNICIVQQSRAYVIERLGAFSQVWEVGIHFKLPFVERIARRVSLKEQVLDYPPQPVITKDNVTMQIDTVVYFQITDPKLYTYGVEQPMVAMETLTATTLRNIIGDLELDQTLTSRDVINTKMRAILDEATDPWGIKVTRVELKNILPPQDIQNSMEKQMKAERERREAILKAEGEKKSTVLVAEGHKESAILNAEADKQAAILRAEAEKEATIREAEGQAEAILKVQQATADGIRFLKEAGADDAVLTMKSLEAFEKAADGKATKIIIPSEIQGIAGLVKSLTEVGAKEEDTK